MSIEKDKLNSINVAVIGGNHHNTLGVIRSLGEQGINRENIHVLLIGNHIADRNIVSVSKYVLKRNVNHDESYDMIVKWLMELAKDKIKRVVICCSDGASEVVISNRNILSNNFYLPSIKFDINYLMEKSVQGKIAMKCGMKIPKCTVITCRNHVEWNCFPCITKPLKSIIGAGKYDICIATSQNELHAILEKLEANEIQIQEFISKKMEFQLIGCSLNEGETIIIPGYTKILRQPLNTNTGYLEYSPIENFDFNLESVNAFIREIGYSGLFSVEFIRAENDTDYFLEINMRNDGNAYCVKSAGVNLPFIWCYYSLFGNLPDMPLSFSKSLHFIPDFNDLKVALSQRKGLKWLGDFFKAESHSIYNRKDINPFLLEVVNQAKKHMF